MQVLSSEGREERTAAAVAEQVSEPAGHERGHVCDRRDTVIMTCTWCRMTWQVSNVLDLFEVDRDSPALDTHVLHAVLARLILK